MKLKTLWGFRLKTLQLKLLYRLNKEKYCYAGCWYSTGTFNTPGYMVWHFHVMPHHFEWRFNWTKTQYVKTVGDKRFFHEITWYETLHQDVKTNKTIYHNASETDNKQEIYEKASLSTKTETIRQK